MKKNNLAFSVALALLTLSACGQKPVSESQNPESETVTVVEEVVKTPELGSFGVDLSARDTSVKPGDDFFEYASGTWYKNYELPADKTRFGAFGALRDRSEERVKVIIDDLADAKNLTAEEQMVADFYHSYMDIDTIDKKGLAPIENTLDKIANVTDIQGLTKLFGDTWLNGGASPIGGGLGTNRVNPDEYEMSIGVGGLGLPDRSYYLNDSERFKDIREAYLAYIAQILSFHDVENPNEKAEQILALETKIAEVQWPREKRRNRDLTLNQLQRKDLAKEYPGFDWDTFLDESGYKVPHLNMTQPQPIKDVIQIINDEPLSVWKDYMAFHTISSNANLLPEDIATARFNFYGTKLRGQKEPQPRWKRAIQQMSGTQTLGFAIGKVYVERYFPESSKEQMLELVNNLKTAMKQRIDGLDWMSAETKKNAQEKLASFTTKIGFPDKWVDYSGLSIKPDDLVGNVQALRKFFREDSVSKELEKTDRGRWGMTPQTVNAYYNSSFNEIVFPAAILQPPFFDPNADPAVNYGAIGAVIGHEIGHGFDDQGSKSDALGVQRNWWTDEDREAFEKQTDQLAAQYDAYEPIPGNHVNGRNSLGENIGDVGGLSMAYHAYQLSLHGKDAPVIDGITGDQRFFLAWAQVWKTKTTEQALLNQIKSDPHAPGRYRTLAPRNNDAWYKAFDVKPGDKLYLAPEDRVQIW